MKTIELLENIQNKKLIIKAMDLDKGLFANISNVTYCPEKDRIVLHLSDDKTLISKDLLNWLKNYPNSELVLSNNQPITKVILATEEICFLYGGN